MLLISIIVFVGYNGVKQFNIVLETKKYVKLYLTPVHKIADSKVQDDFDEIIFDSGLGINNKNVEYSAFEERNDVIKGIYKLTLKGQYLPFINYLEVLQKKNMLYKINFLSLKVKSLDEIGIKLDMESLYEIK